MLLVYILSAILLLVILICIYCFHTCFYAPKNRKEDPYALLDGEQYAVLSEGIFHCTRRMEEAECTYVDTRSFDGLKLCGRYYHHADGAPTMILFHGYRSMALRDSAGGYILGKKLGFNVLAVDQRAHGRSEGRVITFGIRERKDCLSWIRFVNDRSSTDAPVIISGLSMGAATVLMASDLELPDNVAGIIADCPYASPAGIIRKVATDLNFPSRLVYPFIKLSALVFGGFRLEEADALRSVKNAGAPILLLHGEDDRFVPCQMSLDIANNAAEGCKLYTFPDAGHGLCYTTDPERYERICIEFLASQPQLQGHMMQNSYTLHVLKGTL